MPTQPEMTVEQARSYLLKINIAFWVVVLTLLVLAIYGLAHPSRHKALLVILGVTLVPGALAIIVNKSGWAGLLSFAPEKQVPSIRSVLRNHPAIIFTLPVLLFDIPLGIFLVSLWVSSVDNHKQWLQQRPVLVLFWMQVPLVGLAYLCIDLNAQALGAYIACCIIYSTVSIAISGLQLENGIVKFFGTYKAQASPLVIISQALYCCLAFGALHYAIWMRWPSQYVGLHGIEDAVYFSVVTMATVGYGDILPVGHMARWLSVAEIMSGVLLLVMGVSASMTVWLQTKQPKGDVNPLVATEATATTALALGDDGEAT